ncbi:MAG: class II aldolase/adducin family protein [Gammaproteobacteria bacterium]
MNAPEKRSAAELVDGMRQLTELGLNTGRAGNASARLDKQRYLITPSGTHPRDLHPDAIVEMQIANSERQLDKNPSSEWRMHRDIFAAYQHVGAIVHTHSNAATALACMGKSIPAFHYMIAVAGGDSIECAPYATFGTQELSTHAVRALAGRHACLLANHGLIATGATLTEALDLALEVEQLSLQYLMCLNAGKPTILSRDDMESVLEKFKNYGKRTG